MNATRAPERQRLFPLVMTGFVVVLLCSNFIGPGKACELTLPFALPFVGPTVVFGAGNIFFPLSYIFGDVLTEVYGYAKARKVIWAGFASLLFATAMAWVIVHLPPARSEPYNEVLQPALATVFGASWRIVLGSLIGFWAGDFVNSFVLARMKVLTRGKHLWSRTIGSTICGQAVDSLIFYPIAFGGIWHTDTLLGVIVNNWLFKVGVEVAFTPITYWIVGKLKRVEGEDVFDDRTDFNPFSLED